MRRYAQIDYPDRPRGGRDRAAQRPRMGDTRSGL
jgi:hypothetical protein